MSDQPSVWIGCLAAYNEGHLHGEWCGATDVDVLSTTAARVIATSPALGADEWFIADYESFGGLATRLGEYADFGTVGRIGELIERCGPAFLAWVEAVEPDLDSVDEAGFREAYCGEWDDERDFARDFVTDCGWAGVPAAPPVEHAPLSTVTVVNAIDALAPYLDWRLITLELFDHGEHTAVPSRAGGVYVFVDID